MRDTASCSEPLRFSTTHLSLDLTADFEAHQLTGTVTLELTRDARAATELVLDTRELTIHSVEAAAGSGAFAATPFTLAAPDSAFGSALAIAMPQDADRVRIAYTTSADARGLQWLTPAQTAGKTAPFMFTQAQAIQARSFIPLQDTPAVRATFDATIRVPAGLVAVMGAEMTSSDRDAGVYTFHMPQPIPSYLIALAIGDLSFTAMSARTGIWAEPVTSASAVAEFSDTEAMMAATESLYGPYRWGRYDILVLPPSFPFGGMENPRLTFATPTVITGDKSLVSLVAHELAHSWSGNLVTNATWQDFWLNEGFTVYIERRIVEIIFGARRAAMDAVLGLKELAAARAEITVPGDRSLQPDLTGRDPDDAYSIVPYEQGALFLTWIESKVGRPAFDVFLRAWFDEHAFQSATTAQCVAFLKARLLDARPGLVTETEIDEWLHSEGVPAFALLPESDAFDRVDEVRSAWLRDGNTEAFVESALAWTTQEWVHFIDGMPRDLSAARMAALDAAFHLTESTNAEIALVWFRLAIATHYAAAEPAIDAYLVHIGRRKFIVPIYRDLVATPEGKVMAARIYARARAGYHPLAQSTIDQLIG